MNDGGVCMWYACPAVLLCMVERADDDCTPWQCQSTPLHIASAHGNLDDVQVLVDSKADLEAQDEVAMAA